MMLQWANEDDDKGKLYNNGTVKGTLVYEYKKDESSYEVYSKYDYISGEIDGEIYRHEEYKQLKEQQ